MVATGVRRARWRHAVRVSAHLPTRRSVVALAVAVAVLLSVPGTSLAADFSVTKGTDTRDGACNADCSLREAVDAANAAAGFDRILLPAGTYTLTRDDPPGLSDNVNSLGDLDPQGAFELLGAGSQSTIIDAGGIDRHLDVVSIGPSTDTAFVSGVTLRNGDASAFSGGAIQLRNKSLTLTDVVLSGNRAATGGALGIASFTGSVIATLRGVTLRDNTAGSGGGGAIRSDGPGTSLILQSSAVVANHADGGVGRAGGIDSDGGALNLENVTVSGNTTTGEGGGIRQAGASATLTHVTLARNTAAGAGDGLRAAANANIETRNVLIANGGADDCALAGSFPITSSGNDLDAGSTCGFNGAGDRRDADAKLVALADNPATIPGSGPTHALYAGSAAIDAAAPAWCPASDQRGVGRPIGPACDIGAFEAALNPPAEPQAPAAAPAPAGAPATVTAPGVADRTPPRAQITVDPSVFAVAGRSGARRPSRGTAKGATIRYPLSEPARVTITIARKTAGLKLRSRAKRDMPRCVAATKRNRTKVLGQIRRRLGKRAAGRGGQRRALRRSRCSLYATRGVLRRRSATGASSLPFSGRLRGRALRPDTYRAELRATDDAGNRALPVSDRFRIVRNR